MKAWHVVVIAMPWSALAAFGLGLWRRHQRRLAEDAKLARRYSEVA